jgi:hypothetical protein
MGGQSTLFKVLGSSLVVAGAMAIFVWFWPEEGEPRLLGAGVTLASALAGIAVVASLWKK